MRWTSFSDRLYNLVDYADPDDDRLATVASRPKPGSLILLGRSLAGLDFRRRKWAS